MSKIKLKIKHIIDDEEKNYLVDAIQTDNKFIYSYDNYKFTIIKEKKRIVIKIISDIINEIFFEENSSYGIISINNEKIQYKIELINLKILDKIIEIDYKIDKINKFVLEEVYD